MYYKGFRIVVPPTFTYLFFVRSQKCLMRLFQYVAELSLLDMEMLVTFPPSLVAAAAYCLANYTLSRRLWVRVPHTLLSLHVLGIANSLFKACLCV